MPKPFEFDERVGFLRQFEALDESHSPVPMRVDGLAANANSNCCTGSRLAFGHSGGTARSGCAPQPKKLSSCGQKRRNCSLFARSPWSVPVFRQVCRFATLAVVFTAVSFHLARLLTNSRSTSFTTSVDAHTALAPVVEYVAPAFTFA